MDRQPSPFVTKIQNPKSKIQNRSAFTLVEMLVVIVIILILVGLLAAALGPALVRGHEAVILADISQLDSSMKAFKEKYGSYPPSDLTNLLVNKHSGPVASVFAEGVPAVQRDGGINRLLIFKFESTTVPLSPAQAMVFWLSGFSGDPEHPISGRLPQALGGTLAEQQRSDWPFSLGRERTRLH